MRTGLAPEDKMLCGLSGVSGIASMVLRPFDLIHVLVTEQGFEGMEAKRLGQMHKRMWKTRGVVLWRRVIRKLVTLALGFWERSCMGHAYFIPFSIL